MYWFSCSFVSWKSLDAYSFYPERKNSSCRNLETPSRSQVGWKGRPSISISSCHSNNSWVLKESSIWSITLWAVKKKYNKLNSTRVSIGRYLWPIGGEKPSMTSWLTFSLLYYVKQIDSILPCVCSVIDQRICQNVVRTSVTHSPTVGVPPFWSYHFLWSITEQTHGKME